MVEFTEGMILPSKDSPGMKTKVVANENSEAIKDVTETTGKGDVGDKKKSGSFILVTMYSLFSLVL